MRGINKVILIGNATRDAELRHTQTGKAVSSLRLATNRTSKGEEETQVRSIAGLDRLAKTTTDSVKTGDSLLSNGGCSTALSRTKGVRSGASLTASRSSAGQASK